MADMTDLELLGELGVDLRPDKKQTHTPREERIIAGFEEIQKFVEEHGHPPIHGEDRDIFERIYAVRLDQLVKQEECRVLLAALDHQGLLEGEPSHIRVAEDEIDDLELLEQLGVTEHEGDVTVLKHVKPRAEVRAAEEIADRIKCEDFDLFKPLFERLQKDLEAGARQTIPFGRKETGVVHDPSVSKGDFFILGGQTVYVADVGETIKAPNGEFDARLRAIYSNGTESDILRRSLQRALYKDPTSRRVSTPSAGPLFSNVVEEDDLPSGTIYVLRSMSDHPVVKDNREIVHKIGVTGGDVHKRIANAKLDPTFLMADVEIVATYKLANIKRSKMENLLHRVFGEAKLEIQIDDRFGNPVVPREWFLVPLFVIDEVISRISDGTIGGYVYDRATASLTMLEEN